MLYIRLRHAATARQAGIDYPKRYSVVCTVDADGRRVQSARIDQNEPAAFAAYFQRLPAPSRTVQELLGHASVETTQIYTHVMHPVSPRLRRAGKRGLGVRSPLDTAP